MFRSDKLLNMNEHWRDFDLDQPWYKLLRLGKGRDKVVRERKALRKLVRAHRQTATRIAQSFNESRSDQCSGPKLIGNRKTKRNPIPPFKRPETLFKQEVYQLALDIHVDGVVREIEAAVRKRDAPYRHKPRNPTVVDWAIRFVDRVLIKRETTLGLECHDPLLDPTYSGHLATELNFAFKHQIKPRNVAMFIEQVGGYEIISAMENAGGYDLSKEDWVHDLKSDTPKLVSENVEEDSEWADDGNAMPLVDEQSGDGKVGKPLQTKTGSDEDEDWGDEWG